MKLLTQCGSNDNSLYWHTNIQTYCITMHSQALMIKDRNKSQNVTPWANPSVSNIYTIFVILIIYSTNKQKSCDRINISHVQCCKVKWTNQGVSIEWPGRVQMPTDWLGAVTQSSTPWQAHNTQQGFQGISEWNLNSLIRKLGVWRKFSTSVSDSTEAHGAHKSVKADKKTLIH